MREVFKNLFIFYLILISTNLIGFPFFNDKSSNFKVEVDQLQHNPEMIQYSFKISSYRKLQKDGVLPLDLYQRIKRDDDFVIHCKMATLITKKISLKKIIEENFSTFMNNIIPLSKFNPQANAKETRGVMEYFHFVKIEGTAVAYLKEDLSELDQSLLSQLDTDLGTAEETVLITLDHMEKYLKPSYILIQKYPLDEKTFILVGHQLYNIIPSDWNYFVRLALRSSLASSFFYKEVEKSVKFIKGLED